MRDLPALWQSTDWQREVEAWIGSQVCVTGPIEQVHVRFWATVLKAPTADGVVWFKENAPSQSFEAALVAEIDRLAPGSVAPVIATDLDRGWLLTADLGVPLGEDPALTDDAVAIEALVELADSYAALQRRLEGHRREMWEAGVPSFEDGNAFAYAVALADHLAALPLGDGRRLDAAGRSEVAAGLSRIGESAARLEGLPIPESLDHNDLHLWNAFRRPDGQLAVIDLGDAVWSHPFATVRLLCWNARRRLGLEPGHAAYERLVDAYLGHWSEFGSPDELRGHLPAAERVGCLHRAESWRRLMADVPLEVIPAEYLDAPAYWLRAACAADPYAWTAEN